MTQRPTAAPQIVPEVAPSQLDPRWDHARELYDLANRTAGEAVAHAIECGRLLRELRDATSQGPGRPKLSNVGQLFSDQAENAGIPRSTAYDWIGQVDRIDELMRIESGELKRLRIDREIDGEIKQIDRPLKEADRDLAKRLLQAIGAGRIWPKRAWAGFRSGLVTVGQKRAPVDTFALLREALATLDRQLPKLKTLTDDERVMLKKYAAEIEIVGRIAALEDLQ